MKSVAHIILSILLCTSIVIPSVLTLVQNDEKTEIAIDFNEEEKNEEKKEANEKNFFFNPYFKTLAPLSEENSSLSNLYIENKYTSLISIFLPPPKHIG